MKKLTFLLPLCCTLFACAQSIQQASGLLADPDDILIQGDQTPEVLLVGSFHFAYYGADAHVTKEEDKVDVLHPDKQAEVRELVNYIAQFKPTKIAVEGGRNSGYIMRRFEDYLQDSSSLIANEIDQIAFRLMKQFRLDTLYGVNSYGLSRDLYQHPDSQVLTPILDSIYQDWDFRNTDEMSQRYAELYDLEDKLTNQHTILEYFRHMNADKSIDRGWGAYLVGDFKNGSYEGADALAMHWYARNLRILRNIQNITEEGDRILVIFGAGHMTILKYLFQCSPEYRLRKFGELEMPK
ncbi:MAG: DUF5694 domain-containing protein [Bacteroidota bacterium]